jgi:hypothetical protein
MPTVLVTKSGDRPASALLGIDHPLARAIDDCQSTKRQCVAVAAITVGCIRPLVEGHTWAVSLTAAATITLAVLTLVLAGRYQAIRDRAIELIAHGQDTVDVEAIQKQRRRLLRQRTQASLAHCLDDMVRQARRPGSRQMQPAPSLFDYRVIQTVSGDLQTIAVLLRDGRADAPELARLEWLVTHAESALYGHEVPRLRLELQQLGRLLTDDRERGDNCDNRFDPRPVGAD